MTDDLKLSTEALHLLTTEQAWHYRILPIWKSAEVFNIYCEDTVNSDSLSAELEVLFDMPVSLKALPGKQIGRLLSTHYIKDPIVQKDLQSPAAVDAEDFLEVLINEAQSLKSSDIHIEIYEQKCRVRIRIDGMMVERRLLNRDEYPALINKIKIIGNLDIAEKRLPQDGRIHFKSREHNFDIRVSILPTLHGEKIVMRLLNNDATSIDLYKLGFSQHDLENYLHGIRRPNGIILMSGPTGSGKTTTLYATLKFLNKETRNILTIEDPIEYTLEGINQVQLKESIGLNFASALRTFLRQDPDVIMVGEIRDPETANMAIRAALTGHLVLSTIHTNSAWGTISRLIDMGIPPFLVAGTLNTSAAQRLIRLLCPFCKKKVKFNKESFPAHFKPFSTIHNHYIAEGCEYCFYTGYKGRKAVYEVIPIDQELSMEVKNGKMFIHDHLNTRGIKTLAENAFNLFGNGETSLEEIYPLLFNY